MKTVKRKNPFLTKGYISSEYFCDRENELQSLLMNIRNGIDTTLISPRRLGKTGLILRLFEELAVSGEYETIYADIYPARSLHDFIQVLTSAVLKKFPEKTSIGERFLTFIKGFRPLISYDAITGEPQIQLTYQNLKDKEYTLQTILQFLNVQGTGIVLAIDEFQQIMEFPEKNIEALLRTYTQNLENLRFIYCGSRKSMMLDLFSNSKRPFYASTQYLMLENIDYDKYAAFIRQKFEAAERNIPTEVIDFVLQWSKQHTYYTQHLCNKLFSLTDTDVSIEDAKKACVDLLRTNEPVFFQYRQLLTPAQWNFLIAVAKEGEVKQITAQHFIAKHNIGTPANARRLVKSLIDKELILEISDKKEKTYRVYDVFLSRWMEIEY